MKSLKLTQCPHFYKFVREILPITFDIKITFDLKRNIVINKTMQNRRAKKINQMCYFQQVEEEKITWKGSEGRGSESQTSPSPVKYICAAKRVYASP